MTGPGWTCPGCGRRFGRRNQSHVCVPAMDYDEWFRDRPAAHRAIADKVVAAAEEAGPVDVDPVNVGILLKRTRTFAELRPRKGGLALSVILSRTVTDPRVYRRADWGSGRIGHFVQLDGPGDVDGLVESILFEGYIDSPA